MIIILQIRECFYGFGLPLGHVSGWLAWWAMSIGGAHCYCVFIIKE